ncbi:hypothetical protein [Nonomuraea sp. SYSU D8015]|uniref:hypothetical protein n=1 Tax=Nonomuraea sp. SYSU D8015 TaxID=2593644 RepID=UPI001660B198|nr:hypothetical protein [Nonomuraea sp. SYSU D8015]
MSRSDGGRHTGGGHLGACGHGLTIDGLGVGVPDVLGVGDGVVLGVGDGVVLGGVVEGDGVGDGVPLVGGVLGVGLGVLEAGVEGLGEAPPVGDGLALVDGGSVDTRSLYHREMSLKSAFAQVKGIVRSSFTLS